MTNVRFDNIQDYNDVGMLNYYHTKRMQGESHEDLIKVIWDKCRDNARTPMQWNSEFNAGFSSAENTWLKLNRNYVSINVADQMEEEDSILNFYKALIILRKTKEVFVYGTYNLLLPDHPEIFAYERILENKKAIVICNMTDKLVTGVLPDNLKFGEYSLILQNYKKPIDSISNQITLKPYEANVYLSN